MSVAWGESAPPTGDRLAFGVRIRSEDDARLVRRAVAGAFEKLADGRCQAVFSDFRDASGRTLQARLEALGRTGQSHHAQMLFYYGSHLAACRPRAMRRVSAVTTQGSRVVYVCTDQFREGQRRQPFHGETVVIHEVLHSVGLGENPPSSAEINWRVLSRCGRMARRAREHPRGLPAGRSCGSA